MASFTLCSAQASADNQSSILGRSSADDDSQPRSIKESLLKMKIEKEKKEYDRMIERGEEAVKIASELESSLAEKGFLTEKEKAKLASVEKLAKQIRNDLGGDDDGSSEVRLNNLSFSLADAVKSLRASAEDLFNELKKTTRFSISATAIQSSNAVLRIAKFMRIAN